VEVGSEVGGDGGRLDGGGRGERGRQLRALVLLVKERVREGPERGGGGGGGRRRGARGVDERGADGGVLVPDAAERGGEDARDERGHGVARVGRRDERQGAQRVAAERGLVGGARVGDGRDEGRELVGLERARDGLELGGRHGLCVAVGKLEEAAVHALLQRLAPRCGAHGWRESHELCHRVVCSASYGLPPGPGGSWEAAPRRGVSWKLPRLLVSSL